MSDPIHSIKSVSTLMDLPNEVLLNIFDCLRKDQPGRKNAVHSVTLVCRRFDHILRPTLYKDVCVYSYESFREFNNYVREVPQPYEDSKIAPSTAERQLCLVESVKSLCISYIVKPYDTAGCVLKTELTLPNLNAILIEVTNTSTTHSRVSDDPLPLFLLSLRCPLQHFRWFHRESDKYNGSLLSFFESQKALITVDMYMYPDGTPRFPNFRNDIMVFVSLPKLEFLRVFDFIPKQHIRDRIDDIASKLREGGRPTPLCIYTGNPLGGEDDVMEKLAVLKKERLMEICGEGRNYWPAARDWRDWIERGMGGYRPIIPVIEGGDKARVLREQQGDEE
ncbi:hypothetical protein P7C73_g4268, partial [Tremellales sp. Uapishka_1]